MSDRAVLTAPARHPRGAGSPESVMARGAPLVLMTNDDNARRLADLSSRVLETIWESNPVGATVLGIHKYDSTIGDVSAHGFGRCCGSLRNSVRSLENEIDVSLLTPEQELNRRVTIALAESYLLMYERQRAWEHDPSIYGSQAVWGCLSILVRNPGSAEDKLRCVLDRMREIPGMLSAARTNILNPAHVFVETALGVNHGALSFFREELPHLARGTTFEADIRLANENVISAFEDYGKWLRDEVLPRANGDFAVGGRVYEEMLRQEHCLDCTPSDLLSLAGSVLEETLEQIAEVSAAVDPSVPWPELLFRLKQDHPPKEDLVDAYRRSVESARAFALERDLVTIPEGSELSVGVTPEVERDLMPFAAYFPPAPFGDSRVGSLWVTPIDEAASEERQKAQLLEHCIYSIPIIALHEGIPGHHLQLTRAMDSPHLVRRQMLNSLLMEGWALYCEELMHDEGFYSDPRIRLFQLKDAIWRACRVIIDVGLHTGGMSLQEAVDILVEKVYIEEASAVAEVKRYAMTPTQPMTYVVGKLMLLELRDRMKRRLGSGFRLKAFHDRFLSFGSIPIPLIADAMAGEAADVPLLRSA